MGELSNMILGNAATEWSLINVIIDITPLTIIVGEKYVVKPDETGGLSHPVSSGLTIFIL
ncbi:chemotaxis protein CheC [Dehalobacter sp. 4CP]|uniref:chemotaxis protein CheC n=1 Tax=Dehalobacter sp. CP TaxID=2594474 RepID=UPI0039ED42A6